MSISHKVSAALYAVDRLLEAGVNDWLDQQLKAIDDELEKIAKQEAEEEAEEELAKETKNKPAKQAEGPAPKPGQAAAPEEVGEKSEPSEQPVPKTRQRLTQQAQDFLEAAEDFASHPLDQGRQHALYAAMEALIDFFEKAKEKAQQRKSEAAKAKQPEPKVEPAQKAEEKAKVEPAQKAEEKNRR